MKVKMIEDETVNNATAENEIVDEVLEDIIATVPAVATGQLADEDIKNIIEAAIFASSKPVSVDKMSGLFVESVADIREKIKSAIEILMHEYQSRGVELIEVSSGFRFQVAQKPAHWVSRLWQEKPQKYSRALLETLSLIAYRQPVTRGEIEDIRGVSVSSNIMRTLVEREWVRVVGHRDVPGKPGVYATTRHFLDYFGLKRLDELPSLSEIRDFDKINQELDFGEYDVDKINDHNNNNSNSNENSNASSEVNDLAQAEESNSVTEKLQLDDHDLKNDLKNDLKHNNAVSDDPDSECTETLDKEQELNNMDT